MQATVLALLAGQWGLFCQQALSNPQIEYEIQERRVTGLGVNKNMQAELITPVGGGAFPAVLVLHTSSNLGPADIEYARQLARKGEPAP